MFEPVPATSLDDIVSTEAELATPRVGSLWVGEGEDSAGAFSYQGFLVSADGTAGGDGLGVIFFRSYFQTGAAEQDGDAVTTIVRGNVSRSGRAGSFFLGFFLGFVFSLAIAPLLEEQWSNNTNGSLRRARARSLS